jgi:hypothetical protein
MKLTRHALRRSRQRAVSQSMLELALDYGRELESFHDRAFVFDDRSLRRAPDAIRRQADRLRGLCVIVTDDHSVRTVMWRRCKPGLLRRQRLLEAA